MIKSKKIRFNKKSIKFKKSRKFRISKKVKEYLNKTFKKSRNKTFKKSRKFTKKNYRIKTGGVDKVPKLIEMLEIIKLHLSDNFYRHHPKLAPGGRMIAHKELISVFHQNFINSLEKFSFGVDYHEYFKDKSFSRNKSLKTELLFEGILNGNYIKEDEDEREVLKTELDNISFSTKDIQELYKKYEELIELR